MSSKHLTKVKKPRSKPSPMCKSVTNHLSCANPSRTIQGLNIHHVPQIPCSTLKHDVNTFRVTSKANTNNSYSKIMLLKERPDADEYSEQAGKSRERPHLFNREGKMHMHLSKMLL
jgi:hypothetical protein